MKLDLTKIKKVYVIGIKGSGIIAIVQMLHSQGIEILGSDTTEKFFTDAILQKMKIKYFEGFNPENIPLDVDLVIYSTSYNENNNAELVEAKKRNLKIISYPEILASFFNQKFGIAVAGTHGKTTTSAMLAQVMLEAGADPSAVVGSQIKSWEGNALVGRGEYFIAEADEFQNKLQFYFPKMVILTSVDWDHPDFFEKFSDYKKVFQDFVKKIPRTGLLVVWGESVDTLEVAKEATCQIIRYGFAEDNEVRIINYQLQIPEQSSISNWQEFEISIKGKSLGKFKTRLVGQHNVLNVASVIVICYKLNLNMEKVKKALWDFQGTARRFEYIGTRNGAILIDDYGHHPEEIKATLKSAREIYPQKNILAIFQPHTFTRTKMFLDEFAQSFSAVDKVIVLDIYGSARENQGGVSSQDLVTLINKFDYQKAQNIATAEKAVEYLKDKLDQNDVVITIGAGNGWKIVEQLKKD